MKILALEFSSDVRSVAVVEAAGAAVAGPAVAVVLSRTEQRAGRGTRAFALLESALREARCERESIDCLAVGLGPGSYTGIRVAIALAQGWQLAREVRVLGMNSVECLAWQALAAGSRGPATFLLDAQRREFYCARYELSDAAPRIVEPLRLISIHEAQALAVSGLVVEPALQTQFPHAQPLCPDAAMLGQLAACRNDFLTADQLEPVYLRATSFVKAPPPRVIPPFTR